MIYRDEVIEFVKFYNTKRKNLTKLGIENLTREQLLLKICKGIGVATSNKNINKIRDIVNEEFGKAEIYNKTEEWKEKKAIECYNKGMKVKDITNMLGISLATLYRMLEQNNIKRRGRVKKTNTERDLSDEIANKIRKTIKLENISRGLKG